MIERGIAAGTVRRDVDPHAEAVQFCGTLFGLTLQWLIDPAGSPLEHAHEIFVARLERTLRPDAPPSARKRRGEIAP